MNKSNPDEPLVKANPCRPEDSRTPSEKVLDDLAQTVAWMRKNAAAMSKDWPDERARLRKELEAVGLDPTVEITKAWTS